MLRTGIATIGISLLLPLLAAAHTGDHADMSPISIGLDHGALPALLPAVVIVSIVARGAWRKRAVYGRHFGRPSD